MSEDRLSASSGSVPPTFSLQDALTLWPPRDVLYTKGCNQTDGVANCTTACSNPSQAFSTLESLHNCVLYVGVAYVYASQKLSSNDTKLADDLGIQKSELGSPISQKVNSTITACFSAYCDGLPDCTILMSNTSWGGLPYPSNNPLDSKSFNVYNFGGQPDDLCGYITQPSPLNPEIGGIGVSHVKFLCKQRC